MSVQDFVNYALVPAGFFGLGFTLFRSKRQSSQRAEQIAHQAFENRPPTLVNDITYITSGKSGKPKFRRIYQKDDGTRWGITNENLLVQIPNNMSFEVLQK